MSRLLNVDIHGVMVPLVETWEQADMVIQYTKFPPLGKQGANGDRGPRWGVYKDYARQANENLYVIMQCETCLGLKNIEEICQTPGLDCVFIGTGNLSQDLGHPGDMRDPEVMEAISKILVTCKKYGVIPGIVTASQDEAVARIKQGFQLVTCMNDQVFFRMESKKRIRFIRQSAETQATPQAEL